MHEVSRHEQWAPPPLVRIIAKCSPHPPPPKGRFQTTVHTCTHVQSTRKCGTSISLSRRTPRPCRELVQSHALLPTPVSRCHPQSFNHPHLPDLSQKDVYDEFRGTEEAIAAVGSPVCARPVLYRPPFGETTPEIETLLQNMGCV